MKKFVSLLLCLSISLFIVTRTAKPSHTLVSQEEIRWKKFYAESESFDTSDTKKEEVAAEKESDEEVGNDGNDDIDYVSDDEGEEGNGDHTSDSAVNASGDADSGEHDGGDDDAGDDGSGD